MTVPGYIVLTINEFSDRTSMRVELLTLKMLPSLAELAREAEPLFGSPMAEDSGFHEFIRRKVAQQEALAVCDGANPDEVMGVIAFSHHNSAISWLAVFERYRGRGVGSKLLSQALRELGANNAVSVVTFREDNPDGIPARQLYKKFGFADSDPEYVRDGRPGCLMVRPPQSRSTSKQQH